MIRDRELLVETVSAPARVVRTGLTVVIPALDERETIGRLLDGIGALLTGAGGEFEILVVDDGSRDGTAEVAARHGAAVIRHPRTRGYGAAVKTGIRRARFDTVATIDADGQHDAAQLARLLAEIESCDVVIAQRSPESPVPAARRPGKRILKWVADWITGWRIPDLNSGLRVMRRDLILDHLGIAPDGFSFSTTTTIAFLQAGLAIAWVPITTHQRAGGRSRGSVPRDGLNTILLIVRMVMLFAPLRVFLPISGVLFALGLVGGIKDLIDRHIGEKEVIVVLAGIIVFFFGLLADQLASMRRELRR